ncbi:hypothetical protein D3C80_1716390 [compost metagenome]
MATEYLAGLVALLRLYFHLHTEVRNHQACLFGAEVAAFEHFQGMGFAFGGAGSAFALDFFDAPVLATVELAFGHECSVSIKQGYG